MTGEPPFHVRVAEWARDGDSLRAVRTAVFIVEQGIPAALEWDAFDAPSMHALALLADRTPIGCGRLLPDGHIGRMAVVAPWRGRGVGSALLLAIVDAARARGDSRAILNAQTSAMPFYARFGFEATGEAFEEAGIPHRVMARSLSR